MKGLIAFILIVCFGISYGNTERIDYYREKVISANTDELRVKYNDSLVEEMNQYFTDASSFDQEFTLKSAAVINSSDKKVRLINWNLPFENGTHQYFGFVQYKDKSGYKYFQLTDITDSIAISEKKTYTSNAWPGALYYELIPIKKRKNIYYVLLGWDGNDRLTTKKVIDCMYFSKGKLLFGADIFKLDKGFKKRMVFEYSAEYTMTLRYEKDNKTIVFEHLDCEDPKFKGNYEYYGPDGSYDALIIKKGKLNYEPYYDARNDKEKVDKIYRDPRNAPPTPGGR
jgi:hypothetical protein